MNLILIGFFCAGKSSVGQICSGILDLDFVDTDREIEKKFQKKVAEVFVDVGEENFRNLECEILQDLKKRKGLLLSTGGGTVTFKESFEILKGFGTIIYLRASLNTHLERMKKKRFPHFLKSDNPEKEFTKIGEKRVPIYETLADRIIDTDELTIDEVVKQVCECYGK